MKDYELQTYRIVLKPKNPEVHQLILIRQAVKWKKTPTTLKLGINNGILN